MEYISALFGIGVSTVYETVHRTCDVIAEHLLHKHVKWPTEEGLKNIVEEFRWIPYTHFKTH